MDVAKSVQKDLEKIKSQIKRSHDYYKHNYDTFNDYMRFVFVSSLRPDDISLLTTLSMPQLEFNLIETYISNLEGEFAKNEPDVEIYSTDPGKISIQVKDILSQHLNYILADPKNHNTKMQIYREMIGGGFSVIKVGTRYSHPMSMDQEIFIEKAFDPTLCGFDVVTKYPHKGDGRYCYELFPMEQEDFEETYNTSTKDISFSRALAGFNWSYINDNRKIVLVAQYYKKKSKDKRIVKLQTGEVIATEQYDKLIENWDNFSPPPQTVGKSRITQIETICRYDLVDNKILDYVETDFSLFPLIYADGKSVRIKTPTNGNVQQIVKPLAYHAKDAQKFKNYSGIAWANSIENIVQHKFIIKREALPKEEEFMEPIKDIQKPNNIIVNAFYQENPDVPIPDPIREIAKVPAPPEVMQGFMAADSLIQNIMGGRGFDSGSASHPISGKAMIESNNQSNIVNVPYIEGWTDAFSRAFEVYVDIFPKYYATPRTVPIKTEKGKRSFVEINTENGINMNFDPTPLKVIVKAGASFRAQKAQTIMMLKETMQMNSSFARLIGETQEGLNFILENMEGKGIDKLKEAVNEWFKKMNQEKQMAMEQQQNESKNNPAMLKNQITMQKIQMDNQKMQNQIMIENEKIKNEQNKILAQLIQSKENAAVQMKKAETERFSKEVDLELKNRDQAHRHGKEALEMHHKTQVKDI